MSFTKTIVAGNLGQDPELRYLSNGTPVASFSICANERRGPKENRTEEQIWFKVNVFGNSAEAVSKHLQKGDQAYVEGRLKAEMWDGRDGEKHLTLNLNTSGEGVKFLGKRNRASQTADAEATAQTTGDPNPDLSDDDIPF